MRPPLRVLAAVFILAAPAAAQIRTAPVSMFSGVPAGWGAAVNHALSMPEALGMGGAIASLRGLDLSNPAARSAAVPMLLQLQIQGYQPVATMSGRFVLHKNGAMPAPDELKADLQAATDNAAALVRNAAQELSMQAKFGGERVDMLDTAVKLRMLSSDYSLYLREEEHEELARVYAFAESRLTDDAKVRLNAALEKTAKALEESLLDGDGSSLLGELQADLMAVPLPEPSRRGLPKEWVLQKFTPGAKPVVKKIEVPSPVVEAIKATPSPEAKVLTEAERVQQEKLAARIVADAGADAKIAALFAKGGAWYRLDEQAPLRLADSADAQDHKANVSLYDGELLPIADDRGRSLRLGLSEDGSLLTLSMRPQFIGENSGRAKVFPPQEPKVYLKTEAARAPYRPVVRDGLMYDAKGEPYHGVFNFVFDADGRLYLSRVGSSDFAHSTFNAGQPVAGAGEFVIWNGLLVAAGPQTGHYGVTPLHMAQSLLLVRKAGIALDKARLLALYPWNGAEAYFARLASLKR